MSASPTAAFFIKAMWQQNATGSIPLFLILLASKVSNGTKMLVRVIKLNKAMRAAQ